MHSSKYLLLAQEVGESFTNGQTLYENAFGMCFGLKISATFENWYQACLPNWNFYRRFAAYKTSCPLDLAVLTKYENNCDKITASLGAFPHLNLISSYAKVYSKLQW